MALRINAAVFNNIGGRKNNEDNFYLNGRFMERDLMDKGARLHITCSEGEQMYAVCDGMGGVQFGEEASFRTATALKNYQKSAEQLDDRRALTELVEKTSEEVDKISTEHGLRSGSSGSTLAMLIVKDWYFRTVNVGDSRVYLLRHGHLSRMTHDDSEVQRMVDNGQITPEQAWMHPRKNVILKHLGMPSRLGRVNPSVSDRMDLMPGDVFMICSDGICDVLKDGEIEALIRESRSPEDAAETLVQNAIRASNGYHVECDNVTSMVIHVEDTGSRAEVHRDVGKLKGLRIASLAGAAASLLGFAYFVFDFVSKL